MGSCFHAGRVRGCDVLGGGGVSVKEATVTRYSSSGVRSGEERVSLALDLRRRGARMFGGTGALLPAMRVPLLSAAVVIQILLLLVALVPQSVWASRGFPDGPIPRSLSPLVAGLFYALPALTGLLARRWVVAVVLATLPAWLDLGIFAVAAATRIGPFYLAMEPHAVSTVGTLELFAVLGAFGWLGRVAIQGLPWRERAATR